MAETAPSTPASKYAVDDGERTDSRLEFVTGDGQKSTDDAAITVTSEEDGVVNSAPLSSSTGEASEKEEKTQAITETNAPAKKSKKAKRISMFSGGQQTASLNANINVAAFGHKLRKAATATASGNRSIMEIVERHSRGDIHAKKKQEKLELIDNTKQWYTIDPDSSAKQVWDVVVLLLVMINLITIPMSMASQFDMTEDPVFATLVDLIFITDLVLTFLTAFDLSNGERMWNPRVIVDNYIKSGWFFVDFVACVPWEAFAFGDDTDAADGAKYTLLVRALKLPRLLRLGKVFKYLNRFKYAQAWKIIRLLMIMFIAAHWAGCLFFFMCELQDNTMDTPWCNQNEYIQGATEGSTKFLVAFHTAFLMLVGEDIGPTTDAEYIYTLLMLVAGQIISAVVIGNISIVLNNQASMSALYMQKMDRVNESMMTHKLPTKLQNKGKYFTMTGSLLMMLWAGRSDDYFLKSILFDWSPPPVLPITHTHTHIPNITR